MYNKKALLLKGGFVHILKNIKIKGFKSIKDMNLDLNPINIIIGPNGSGKSNFISIFQLLNKIINKELQSYIAVSGGANRFLYFGNKITQKIDINLTLNENSYNLSLVPAVPDTLCIDKEQVCYQDTNCKDLGKGYESHLKDDDNYKSNYTLNFLEKIMIYHFHDVGINSPIKKRCSINDNIYLQAHADNLPAMLYKFKESYKYEYDEIISVVKMVAPFFKDFVLEPENNSILLRWKHTGTDKIFDVYDLSDGTLRFIAFATLLLQPNCPDIILIDEPELGLHPYALKILAELFESITKKGKQIVATSQSVEFINEFGYKDIIVADRKEDQTIFKRLYEKEIKEWLNDFAIGTIWSKNVIGGTPNDC